MTLQTDTGSTTWWPSRYGADDEAGSLNEIAATTVVGAARLVRSGRIYDLAHVLDADIPVFPGRSYRQDLTTRGGQHLGDNDVNWTLEQVTATSQMGTHVDGLNHLQIGDRTYNGHRVEDIVEPWGTSRLGIETLPQIATRGVLLDIASARGVSSLEAGDVIRPSDAVDALERQGLTIAPGDAALFHTGWGRQWGTDNDRYAAGEPGPGIDLALWLVEQRIALSGCDTWSFGPVPPEDLARPFIVPQTLNAKHGVVIAENLRLEELAEDAIHEFLLVIGHTKLRGATGSWIAPLAIV